MELEEVPLEKKRHGADAGAIEPAVEFKTKEEAQPDHYSKLQTPAEDVYAEAFFGDSKAKAGKQTVGHARLYRAGCIFLTLICLVLVLVVIVLSLKLQSGFPVCKDPAGADPSYGVLTLACNYAQCQTNFPRIQKLLGCNRCADGWLMFEDSCFYMSTVRMTWTKSQSNCTAGGGSLAVISRPDVQTFLTEMDRKVFWIGLQHVANRWRWVDNSALRDSYWEDDLSKGDCGLLRTSGPKQKNWMTAPCTQSTYFICQKPV